MNILKIAIILLLVVLENLLPCTTAIVSGKGTPDGRPLLLKHRDSSFDQNKLMYFKDGKYHYIGLVNSVDSLGLEVWGGCNSVGFAIINSASYNIKDLDDETKIKDREGIIMKLALQQCRTIEDFEELLRELDKPLGVEANFGVIDAFGGAAYYETNNFTFTKIDVNDPNVAPFGYVIRTNYSFYGRQEDGYGYIRYLNAENLFYNAAAANDLDHRFILQDVSRSLKHSLTGIDLRTAPLPRENNNKFVHFQDFTPRKSSVSTILIQGVKENEAPELSTLWIILGFPFTSVAIPTWVDAGDNLPKILVAGKNGNTPLCEKALILKKKCFPITRGSGWKYINLSRVINREETGYLQYLRPVEDQILRKAGQKLVSWREKGNLPKEDVLGFYRWVNKFVNEKYEALD